MEDAFKPLFSFFKPQVVPTSPQPRDQKIDVDVGTKNIFQNNILYFQKYKDLEERVKHLEKLNGFLVSQVLQSLGSVKLPTDLQTKGEAVRKRSMKFDDDRCLNKTFQLFKLYKYMLDTSGEYLGKISDMFFPPDFDFEQSLYTKNHQKIINLLLKSSINSMISLKDEVSKSKANAIPHLPDGKTPQAKNGAVIGDSSLLIRRELHEDLYSLKSRESESGKGGSDPGELKRQKPKMLGATGERNIMQHTISDGLSMSQNKLGLIEDPMFSDSFLNQTDIKNHLLRPFHLAAEHSNRVDKSTQVHFQEVKSVEESLDSNHFSII